MVNPETNMPHPEFDYTPSAADELLAQEAMNFLQEQNDLLNSNLPNKRREGLAQFLGIPAAEVHGAAHHVSDNYSALRDIHRED